MSKVLILNTLSIVISIGTLLFSWYTYDKYQQTQVQTKQIEAMTSLVDYIHKNKIKFKYYGVKSSTCYNRTLFELNRMDSSETDIELYFDINNNCPINFIDYSTNPFIPKQIADILVKFYSYNVEIAFHIDTPTKDSEYCILSSVQFAPNQITGHNSEAVENENIVTFIDCDTICYYKHSPALKYHNDLIRYSCDLKEAIIDWYKDQGLDNINIRENDYLLSLE